MSRLRRAIEIPAASLADIAFLLMIFFLITITITTARGFRFTLPAESDTAAALSRQDVLIVRLFADASVSVDGRAVDGRVLLDFLEEERKERSNLSVIFEVARASSYGDFARAVNQIRLAGFGHFAIRGVD